MTSRSYLLFSLCSMLCLMPSLVFAQSSGGVPALQQDLVALTVVVTNVKADLQTTKGSLQATQADLATSKADLAQARSELASTKALLTNTQSDLANTQNDLMSVKADLHTTKGRIDQLQTDLSSVDASTTLKADKTDVDGNVQALRDGLVLKTDKTYVDGNVQVLRDDLVSKTDKTDFNIAVQALKTDLGDTATQMRSELTSKQEISDITKAALKVLAERFQAIQRMNLIADLLTAGGEIADVTKAADVINKLEMAAGAFEAAANLELVLELGRKAAWTQAANTAKQGVDAAKQAVQAGQPVKCTEVYDKVVSEMEKEVQSLADARQATPTNLQTDSDRYAKAEQAMTTISKMLHETSTAIIANLK